MAEQEFFNTVQDQNIIQAVSDDVSDDVCECDKTPYTTHGKIDKDKLSLTATQKRTAEGIDEKNISLSNKKKKVSKMEHLLNKYEEFHNYDVFEDWLYQPEQINYHDTLSKFMKYIKRRDAIREIDKMIIKYNELEKNIERFMLWINEPDQSHLLVDVSEFKQKLKNIS